MAACGMRCIDLNNDMLKILGTHFSYNEKLKEEKEFYKINRYSTRFENMENEKPYTGRGNCYFKNNTDIKNCFPIIYNNCPKTFCEQT